MPQGVIVLLGDILYCQKYPHYRTTLPTTNQILTTAVDHHSCGDHLVLSLELADATIVHAAASGSLCAIANFGTEKLLDYMIGRNLSQLPNSTKLLAAYPSSESASLLNNPIRLRCFELAQVAMRQLQISSTAAPAKPDERLLTHHHADDTNFV